MGNPMNERGIQLTLQLVIVIILLAITLAIVLTFFLGSTDVMFGTIGETVSGTSEEFQKQVPDYLTKLLF